MPWVLEETFAAGGLDLHAEVALRRLDPLYRIHWAGEERALRLRATTRAAARAGRAKFSAARRAPRRRLPRGAEADLRAGHPRPPAGAPSAPRATSPRCCRRMVRLGAVAAAAPLRRPLLRAPARARGVLLPLAVHRRRPVPRARRSTARSSTSRCSTAAGTRTAASTRWSRRWRGRSTSAAASGSSAIEQRGGRVTGVRLAGGERLAADVVVSNADVLRTHELLGRPRAAAAPAADDVVLPALPGHRPASSSGCRHHTLLVGSGYREFIRTVTRGGELPRTFSTYVHAPARTEPGMAAPGGDSLGVLLPGPEPARAGRLGARGGRAARRAAGRPRDDASG